MIFKKINPTTASQRNLIRIKNIFLNKYPLLKSKIIGIKNASGRNHQGKITIRHKGNGHKQKYRKIDFCRNIETTSIVLSIEYDPCRNANIASIFDLSKCNYNYIISPKNLHVGDIIKSGYNANAKLGHSLPLYKIPVGSYLYNIATKLNNKGQICRAAGTSSILLEKTSKLSLIKLKSGKSIYVSSNCFASLGIVSNDNFFLTTLGKAGRSRWLNKRPVVRGVAMNPIDHPNGGGEGKTSGSRLTPWGKSLKSKN